MHLFKTTILVNLIGFVGICFTILSENKFKKGNRFNFISPTSFITVIKLKQRAEDKPADRREPKSTRAFL